VRDDGYQWREDGQTYGSPWRSERDCVQARVIADSISPEDIRLTTLEVTMHRFVLAEFNTHRVFSRNSESSRAVPFPKRLQKVLESPAIPLSFPMEQRGMQGGAELEGEDLQRAKDLWLEARTYATTYGAALSQSDVHKSIANRLLEPFLWHTVVVTATEWEGFFHQRLHADAQPEIRAAAHCMWSAMDNSLPTPLRHGDWHLPFITRQDREEMQGDALKQISSARCARTSYVTHDGHRSLEDDLLLYKRLVDRAPDEDNPHHWSPLEHVATPWQGRAPGNFRGWLQHRHELDASPYERRTV
jgi:thymidylate synthase ThyX